MVFEDIAKFAKGGAITLVGGGVLYLSKYIPENLRPIGYAGGLGISAYGLYSIYKAFKGEGGVRPPPNLQIPIVITDPRDGERWSMLLPHNVNVEVSNPYNQTLTLFVGMTMIHESGEVYDFPVKSFDLYTGKVKKLSWWMQGSPQGPGWYRVISSVWDEYPVPPCEEEGRCHRLGTAESNVEFGWFG